MKRKFRFAATALVLWVLSALCASYHHLPEAMLVPNPQAPLYHVPEFGDCSCR